MFDTPTGVVGLPEDYLCSGGSYNEAAEIAETELSWRLIFDDPEPEDRHVLPDGLEDLPVGPYLAAIVGSVDPSMLNGHDLVRLMKARARLASSNEAHKLEAISEVAFCPPGDADSPVERSPNEIEYASCEIAPALTLTRRGAETQLDLALHLTGRLHRVLDRFRRGVLDLGKVRVFVSFLAHLDQETVDTVLDQILDAAGGLTSGQLRARLARLVLEADPEAAAHSLKEGILDRKVVVSSNPDLTGDLAILSADPLRVAQARTHVEVLARTLKTGDEPRTLDQLRADIALDLLTGHCLCGTGNTKTGGVQIHTQLETLAGLSDTPGELGGYGPVIAEITRKTVYESLDGVWTFLVTHNGHPVSTGTLNRRPTTAQKHHLSAVYPTCVHPGCRQPAYDCDLDHRKPVSAGGPTSNHNLAPLCRYHHMARHHTPWQLEQTPNGDHIWTSPLGHTYTRKRDPPH